MHPVLLAALALPLAAPALALAPSSFAARAAIAQAVADPGRPDAERARDAWRHPVDTLAFFGVAPGQTVVEYSPGGGWYTRILAPLERTGSYVALVQNGPKVVAGIKTFLAADPARFGKARVAMVDPVTGTSSVPANSADVVLTFRNIHNVLMQGNGADAYVFAAFYRMLKPGGTLGVVEHRLPEDRDAALEQTSGYVKRSTVVRLAEQAGFKLVGESQINANPRDGANYPRGVWTLPPTLTLGAADRDHYLAIGESDRMTLRFIKPRPQPVPGLPTLGAPASAPSPPSDRLSDAMAEEGMFPSEPVGNGADTAPQAAMIAQYVKDLSFENPSAPGIYQTQTPPRIDVQFNIGAQQIAEDVHEVSLKIEVRATIEQQTAFAVELVYAGLFGIRNVPEEQLPPFLFAEGPRLLFPFARRVVADATRDGNFPPLLLDPIDFAALYMSQAEQAGQLAAGETAGQA